MSSYQSCSCMSIIFRSHVYVAYLWLLSYIPSHKLLALLVIEYDYLHSAAAQEVLLSCEVEILADYEARYLVQ